MTKLSKILISLFIVLAVVLPTLTCNAQPIQNGRYYVQDGSKIWIDGKTTVNNFSCSSKNVNGYGVLVDTAQSMRTSLPTTYHKTKVHVTLPVNTMDCGKKRMNKDMYHAMKAQKYPSIKYDLLNVKNFTKSDTSSKWFTVNTTGQLTIAGKSRVIHMTVDGHMLPDGRFHVEGQKNLDMTSFGIDPPSPFWGLIKTKDEITVHFDLYVAQSNLTDEHNDKY
ncbi:MAG TPA: YceI family protein [Balneolales bacterium]|nr:YceI family protein [Balneolales bacterium]